MVTLAALLLLAVQTDGDWRPMPAEANIPRMLFACSTRAGGFYSIILRKDARQEYVRILHVPPGASTGNRVDLTGAVQSLWLRETSDAMRYRVLYSGNDQAGVPTRLTVVMTAPQPAETNGVRTATFTVVRGNQTVTQENCTKAPPPPELSQ